MYELPSRKGLDCAAFFELLSQWFQDLYDDAVSPNELSQELQDLFDQNPQLDFVKKVRQLKLCETSELLLVKFCYFLVCKDDDDIRFGQMEDVFESSAAFTNAKVSSGKVLMPCKNKS